MSDPPPSPTKETSTEPMTESFEEIAKEERSKALRNGVDRYLILSFAIRALLVDAHSLERKRLENEIDERLDELIEDCSWNELADLREFLLTQTRKKWKSKRYQKVKAMEEKKRKSFLHEEAAAEARQEAESKGTVSGWFVDLFSRRAELDVDTFWRSKIEQDIDAKLDELIDKWSWNRLVYLRDFLKTQSPKQSKSKRYQKVLAKVLYPYCPCAVYPHRYRSGWSGWLFGRSCVSYRLTLTLLKSLFIFFASVVLRFFRRSFSSGPPRSIPFRSCMCVPVCVKRKN